MRWVFLTLLCLNLLVAAWFISHQNSHDSHRKLSKSLISSPASSSQAVSGRTAVPSLVLLSELSDPQLSYKVGSANQRKSHRCYSLGPLIDSFDAKHLKVRASALGFTPEFRALAVEGDVSYWVHIRPFSSYSLARTRLEELQARRIDSYIIAKGELRGGISLGLFKRLASAHELMEKMTSYGYPSQMREVTGGAKNLWLEFPHSSKLNKMSRDRIIKGSEGMEWMLADCSAL